MRIETAKYKPLATCGMEELAAHQRHVVPKNGVLFARKADGEEKIAARQRVLDLFAPDVWTGRLHMLTMPGLKWRFERLLLGMRELGWTRSVRPRGTYFTSVEQQRSLYYAGVEQMPGMATPETVVKTLRNFSFAEHGLKTNYASYFLADIDEFMLYEPWDQWDAVWLDYTGPLSVRRLDIIQRFYQKHISGILIVTALASRFDETTTAAVHQAGSYIDWIIKKIDGDVLHAFEYFDTSAMVQVAIRKPTALWHWGI